MIDRYSITITAAQLAERFSVDVADTYHPHFNAAPTQILPVITNTASGGLSFFFWGTSPEWSKNKMLSEKMVNTRREFFDEKPALRRAMTKTRCIIPADGFYAWKKLGKKTSSPYRFTVNNGELFAMAGLWEEFEDTDGNEIQTFTVVTVPSNEIVSNVTERMPLILAKDDEQKWLAENDEEQLILLLDRQVRHMINFYPVSPGISNTTNDLPSMIIATPPSDQHGNLTLFD